MIHKNLAETVRQKIMQKLINGEYRPGHQFILKELMENEFKNISQTPIREALLQLTANKILISQRGFTVRVPVLSVEQIKQAREMRLRLEFMAASKAMHLHTSQDLINLKKIHAKMMLAKMDANVEQLLQRNVEFHFNLSKLSGDDYLSTMLTQLWAITGPTIRFLYDSLEPAVYPEDHPHLDMIAAIKKKDEPALHDALKRDNLLNGDLIYESIRRNLSADEIAVQAFKPILHSRQREIAGKKIKADC